MVRNVSTILVFAATCGDRFLEAVAQQRETTSIPESPLCDRLIGSRCPALGDITVARVVPVTTLSFLIMRSLGQSAPTPETSTYSEIAKEIFLAIILTLLPLLFIKQVIPHWKEVVLPARQPTAWADPVKPSPQNVLITCSTCSWKCLARWLAYPWQLGRRCVQRRRLYIHHVVSLMARLETVLPSLFAPPSPLTRLRHQSAPGSHNLHDWHEAAPAKFLMPVEVAACRSPPEVCALLERLLGERWWDLECPQPPLESVPENDCLVLEEELPYDLPENFAVGE